MGAPDYQASDFLSALQSLMPRGLAWPRDSASVMAQVEAGLAPTWVRLVQQDNNLLVDAFPSTSVQLLPEWEAALGLPDPCAGVSPTIQLRQKQVVARFAGSGGQSIPYFTQYAGLLGYAVTVTEFAPFRFGQNTFGTPLYGAPWAFAWQVNAPTFSLERFRFGVDAFGEPLAYWNNNVLQCELQSCAPAHTILLFDYS